MFPTPAGGRRGRAGPPGVDTVVRFSLLVCLAVLLSACSARHARDLQASAAPTAVAPPASVEPPPALPPADSSPADARPAAPRPRSVTGPTIEGTDPVLAAALAAATLAPTPARLHEVAAEYRRVGVLDLAIHHAQRALTLAPDDPATHDLLARLWRDAGFPELGLTAAHRAVFLGPAVATYRNTLGTLLQALGHRDLAHREYEQATALDPRAWYAFNNLCYSWTLDGRPIEAIEACQRALVLEPGSVAARNNLALALAVAGDRDSAVRMFHASGNPARARYNEGVLDLAQGRFATALESFEAAHALDPNLEMARRRARQAAAAALAEE